jgi:hypothetical protein
VVQLKVAAGAEIGTVVQLMIRIKYLRKENVAGQVKRKRRTKFTMKLTVMATALTTPAAGLVIEIRKRTPTVIETEIETERKTKCETKTETWKEIKIGVVTEERRHLPRRLMFQEAATRAELLLI